jgi:UDP-N-acetylmuramyl-tripeptide synthetase
MLLADLIQPLPEKELLGRGNPEVTSLAYDSRRVAPGALFICIRGEKFNGHDFANSALEKGAVAILADDRQFVEKWDRNVPVVLVPNSRRAMPILAGHFHGYPSRLLKLIGVTGTKGKTTTTYLISSILHQTGLATGVVGTLGARICSESIPLERTTPEAVDIQELLARMVRKGVSAVAMEVSSHALAFHRTEGCEFDVGVFTNLSHDHLDFHRSLDEYLETKVMLFREYPKKSQKRFVGIINADDPRSDYVCRAVHGDVITFGVDNHSANIRATNVSFDTKGLSYTLETSAGRCDVSLKLRGAFNVYNSLAAASVALALGLELEDIRKGLESLSAVDGRFECIDCGQDFTVVVDYAHSPASLESVLKSAKELTSGRIITVFGCGGDRDKAKRPIMGKIASNLSDVCIVTSDNPRSEDPNAIINEILAGIEDGHSIVEAIVDRREAIKRSLEIARPGDLVLIAGKGHETYQIFRDQVIHFDDREVVRELLSDLRSGG